MQPHAHTAAHDTAAAATRHHAHKSQRQLLAIKAFGRERVELRGCQPSQAANRARRLPTEGGRKPRKAANRARFEKFDKKRKQKAGKMKSNRRAIDQQNPKAFGRDSRPIDSRFG
ncbi:hypothetical protein B0T26DRAFT_680902 [Lasiosphaeria miniovina]|uniref:Uncharacterized protein n=1 Tax=Lasiosphaeria miniovina TaxID=1954250 RepID=A0AA40DH08_9PEZI|nr:uncharacterized protein B0T26DRAFT_680902 [Lasiosphaeria miniovina]KAK0703174.1 hypothetical protein B0T26DRAFT_680902 [Lasiosphaeria miniovina]